MTGRVTVAVRRPPRFRPSIPSPSDFRDNLAIRRFASFSLHSGAGTQCKFKGFPSTGLFGPWMTRKDVTMVKFTSLTALALAAAMALTVTSAPQTAQAQPAASTPQIKVSDTTDISPRRYARRGYRNNAAGLAFMGLALGTVGAVIANQQRQDYYRQNYYYGGNPYYGGRYYGSPGYYGSGYYNPY